MEVRRTEGVNPIVVECAFFASPEGDAEGPVGSKTAAKQVVGGMADEDLSREDEVATDFAVMKREGS